MSVPGRFSTTCGPFSPSAVFRSAHIVPDWKSA
jgi:hypothetical protein